MKFKLYGGGVFYDYANKTELEGLGFEFDKVERTGWYADENYQIKGHPEIEFNTLEELVKFSREWGDIKIYNHDLVVFLEG